jgi:hypothetical protein
MILKGLSFLKPMDLFLNYFLYGFLIRIKVPKGKYLSH